MPSLAGVGAKRLRFHQILNDLQLEKHSCVLRGSRCHRLPSALQAGHVLQGPSPFLWLRNGFSSNDQFHQFPVIFTKAPTVRHEKVIIHWPMFPNGSCLITCCNGFPNDPMELFCVRMVPQRVWGNVDEHPFVVYSWSWFFWRISACLFLGDFCCSRHQVHQQTRIRDVSCLTYLKHLSIVLISVYILDSCTKLETRRKTGCFATCWMWLVLMF